MRAEEERVLDSYGWVDAQRGIVHIPIARAYASDGRAGAAGARRPGALRARGGPDKSNSGRTTPSAGR